MAILTGFLITVHVIVCLLLVTLALMQRPRSEGLGAAFGGGMTDNFFGAQTSNVLSKATVYLGIAFFVISLLLAIILAKRSSGPSAVERKLMPAAVAPAVPEGSASNSPAIPSESPVAVPAESPAAPPAAEASPAVSPS